MISLFSSILASWVRQRVEFTTVAEYPASAVQIAMSRTAVVRRLWRTTPTVGNKIPKNVAYVQRVMELPKREFLLWNRDTFPFDIRWRRYRWVFAVHFLRYSKRWVYFWTKEKLDYIGCTIDQKIMIDEVSCSTLMILRDENSREIWHLNLKSIIIST